jgi:hypothetical protein
MITSPSTSGHRRGTSAPANTRRVSISTSARDSASAMANADSGATCCTIRQVGMDVNGQQNRPGPVVSVPAPSGIGAYWPTTLSTETIRKPAQLR